MRQNSTRKAKCILQSRKLNAFYSPGRDEDDPLNSWRSLNFVCLKEIVPFYQNLEDVVVFSDGGILEIFMKEGLK